MAGCLSFSMFCFGLGDLNIVGTIGIDYALDNSGPRLLNIVSFELGASVGLVEVILSMNNSRDSREMFVCDKNSSQNALLIGDRQ